MSALADEGLMNVPTEAGYKPLATPIRITEHRWPAGTRPVVSICCITFNHERFICQTLEGFFMQETTFPVEILVHDDASTDRTADIVRSFQQQYPQLIKPIYQQTNQYSQGKKPGRINRERSQGDYIAWCEGDDYWTDPNKLQLQWQFLESNPDYVVSGHDARVITDTGKMITPSKLAKCWQRDFSAAELIRNEAVVLTLTLLHRNVLGELPPEGFTVINGDSFQLSLLGWHGKSKFHDDIKPAVYRVHDGGVWSALADSEKERSLVNTRYALYRYYTRIGEREVANFYFHKFVTRAMRSIPAHLLLSEFIRRLLPHRYVQYCYAFWLNRKANRQDKC